MYRKIKKPKGGADDSMGRRTVWWEKYLKKIEEKQ